MEINNEISEYYCSYEVSKLLKEKGCRCNHGVVAYSLDGKNRISILSSFYDERKYPIIEISHALAIEWIRVNFGIHICSPLPCRTEMDKIYYSFQILSEDREDNSVMGIGFKKQGDEFNSTFETTEAALIYVLENLIN